MDNIIIEQIKKFTKGMNESDSLTNLRKTPYTQGYKDCLKAIGEIIAMGEHFQKEGESLLKESEVKSG